MNESQIKDEILKYSIKDGTDDNFIIAEEIIQKVFPEMDNEEMMYHISEILKYPQPILDAFIDNETYVIKADITTIKFLEKGGFSKLEEIEKEKAEKIHEKEVIELELARSNIKANELNKKVARQNFKNEKSNIIATWINIVIGIVNLGLLVWQALKS